MLAKAGRRGLTLDVATQLLPPPLVLRGPPACGDSHELLHSNICSQSSHFHRSQPLTKSCPPKLSQGLSRVSTPRRPHTDWGHYQLAVVVVEAAAHSSSTYTTMLRHLQGGVNHRRVPCRTADNQRSCSRRGLAVWFWGSVAVWQCGLEAAATNTNGLGCSQRGLSETLGLTVICPQVWCWPRIKLQDWHLGGKKELHGCK